MATILGENLRYYRSILGLTQEDLAKKLDVTRASIANYEVGRSEPSFEILCRLAYVLGVGLEDLRSPVADKSISRTAQITEDEWAFLQVYREADPTYKVVAYDVLKAHRRQG